MCPPENFFPGGPRNNFFSPGGGVRGLVRGLFFGAVYYVNFDKFEFSKWEGIMIQPYFENFTPRPPSIAVVSEGHEYKIHMTNLS